MNRKRNWWWGALLVLLCGWSCETDRGASRAHAISAGDSLRVVVAADAPADLVIGGERYGYYCDLLRAYCDSTGVVLSLVASVLLIRFGRSLLKNQRRNAALWSEALIAITLAQAIANIMLDEEGHIIHIDFGFIFEISPGGNLKFERAPFRLTKEMIELMGGSKHDPVFVRFRNLLVQCFMAVRSRHEELESIAYLMMNAGFPCFRADSIKKLQQRFFLDKKTKDVLAAVDDLIDSAYEATSTTVYDGFQMASNQIFF